MILCTKAFVDELGNQGFPVVILADGLIEMKKRLGRLKDLKDLQLIIEFKMTKKHHM